MSTSEAARSTPTEIRKKAGDTLRLRWQDGHESVFQAVMLRSLCPCASCVDEVTGVRQLRAEDVPDSIRMQHARLVGNYALQIEWSDGHQTGLYSFSYLRDICPCQACTAAG